MSFWSKLFGTQPQTPIRQPKPQPSPQPIPKAAETPTPLQKAAEAGDADAQFKLGIAHNSGKGAKQDDTEAVRWLRKAADQGHAEALFSVGVFCNHGLGGLPKSPTEALNWWRKAAEKGHLTAFFNLGLYHERGTGVPADPVEAVKWYRQGAELGDTESQNVIGYSYEHGNLGFSKDSTEAVKWYRKAAEAGHLQSQHNLALAYQNGTGVAKNINEALKWLRTSAAQGNDASRIALQVLEQRIRNGDPAVQPNKFDDIVREIQHGTGQGAQRLIDAARIDINTRGQDGMTLLCYAAASKGLYRLIERMINAGADVTLSNEKKQTALHLAAATGDVDAVSTLLYYKAPVNALDEQGRTPLDVAESMNHANIVKLIREQQQKPTDS